VAVVAVVRPGGMPCGRVRLGPRLVDSGPLRFGRPRVVVWPWRTHVTCCGAATHIFLQLAPDLLIFLKAQASKVIEFRSSRLSPTGYEPSASWIPLNQLSRISGFHLRLFCCLRCFEKL
jgi:hypothetical protein